MEKYISLLKECGADLAALIDPKSIVTAAWVVYKCKYGCGTYGKNHCCPPSAPTWRETQDMIDCYDTAILFRCHDMAVVTPLAVKVARELLMDDYYKVIAFGSGPCRLCTECNPDRCIFPAKTVPSMEACGIDVFATVRANDIEIKTLTDKNAEQSCFGLLLVK